MKLFNLSATLVFTTGLALTGCTPSEPVTTVVESTETKVDSKAKSESKLPDDAPHYKVYTITSFEPYCFRDENGNSTGFDIDIMNAIGERMGFKTSYITAPWKDVLPALSEGQADIVASAVMIKEDRKKKYDFSTPYMVTNLALTVSDTYKDKSFDEIIADKKINYSLIAATAAEKTLTDTLGVSSSQITGVETQYLAIEKVFNTPKTATFENEAVLRYYGKNFKGLHIKPYKAEKVELGFVVKKGNVEMVDQINQGLNLIKVDGTFNKIYAKWFGDMPQ